MAKYPKNGTSNFQKEMNVNWKYLKDFLPFGKKIKLYKTVSLLWTHEGLKIS
jgi:hypothetical protein